MTKEQKIIRAKVGVLELAKTARQCQPSLQNDGLQKGTWFASVRSNDGSRGMC